jgi:hypothetical protein
MASSDSGVSSTDEITNDTTPTFEDDTEANAFVQVYDLFTLLGTTTANGSGDWTFTTGVLSEGDYQINARLTDVAGNRTTSSSILDITIDTTAPQVIGVTISGSGSTHDPYDIPDGSGTQIKTVPVGGADTIAVTFSENVGAGVEKMDLSLFGAHTSTSYDVVNDSTFAYNSTTKTATWTFGAVFPADQMVLTLADTASDIAGNALDGEWTNPSTLGETGTSTFPSGNAAAGGDFEFWFTILPGDAIRDNYVDGLDYVRWAAYYGTMSGATFEDADFDGDGDVDGVDYVQWAGNYGIDFRSFGGSFAMMMESTSLRDRLAAARDAVMDIYNSGLRSWADDALNLFDLDVEKDPTITIEDFFVEFKTFV